MFWGLFCSAVHKGKEGFGVRGVFLSCFTQRNTVLLSEISLVQMPPVSQAISVRPF